MSRRKTQWTRIHGTQAYVFAPMDGYFEGHFALGDEIKKGQLAGWMHHLDRPHLEPKPVYFQSSGMLYAHGLIRQVLAGQNLAVLVEKVISPI